MSDELIAEGQRIMTICNACRYCEGFCAVFPAVERRLTFAESDMNYLANLCHNCAECLYACQYSPPHAFAVNVPQTLAKIRQRSYEKYCWPAALGSAFRRQSLWTVSIIAAACFLAMLLAVVTLNPAPLLPTAAGAHFYALIPHALMAGLFGGVFLFVVLALAIGVIRYLRDTQPGEGTGNDGPSILQGLRDALTLRNLHAAGADCTTDEEVRTRTRRWLHHLTLYGFLLCFLSTGVASLYHFVLHREAPYPLLSAPVVLGTLGGIGLLLGSAGFWLNRARRDPQTMASEQAGPDRAFILLLVLTSASGLLLLLLRERGVMGLLLLAHLALVLTLFVTLPYGKFVHGLYRTAALIQSARESRQD